jgi:hypothetical protein
VVLGDIQQVHIGDLERHGVGFVDGGLEVLDVLLLDCDADLDEPTG